MQINRWLIFIIAISALIVETNAATITAEAPGTVFTNREPLRFQLNQRPPAPLRYEVRNFRGRIVTAGEWSGEGNRSLLGRNHRDCRRPAHFLCTPGYRTPEGKPGGLCGRLWPGAAALSGSAPEAGFRERAVREKYGGLQRRTEEKGTDSQESL